MDATHVMEAPSNRRLRKPLRRKNRRSMSFRSRRHRTMSATGKNSTKTIFNATPRKIGCFQGQTVSSVHQFRITPMSSISLDHRATTPTLRTTPSTFRRQATMDVFAGGRSKGSVKGSVPPMGMPPRACAPLGKLSYSS